MRPIHMPLCKVLLWVSCIAMMASCGGPSGRMRKGLDGKNWRKVVDGIERTSDTPNSSSNHDGLTVFGYVMSCWPALRNEQQAVSYFKKRGGDPNGRLSGGLTAVQAVLYRWALGMRVCEQSWIETDVRSRGLNRTSSLGDALRRSFRAERRLAFARLKTLISAGGRVDDPRFSAAKIALCHGILMPGEEENLTLMVHLLRANGADMSDAATLAACASKNWRNPSLAREIMALSSLGKGAANKAPAINPLVMTSSAYRPALLPSDNDLFGRCKKSNSIAACHSYLRLCTSCSELNQVAKILRNIRAKELDQSMRKILHKRGTPRSAFRSYLLGCGASMGCKQVAKVTAALLASCGHDPNCSEETLKLCYATAKCPMSTRKRIAKHILSNTRARNTAISRVKVNYQCVATLASTFKNPDYVEVSRNRRYNRQGTTHSFYNVDCTWKIHNRSRFRVAVKLIFPKIRHTFFPQRERNGYPIFVSPGEKRNGSNRVVSKYGIDRIYNGYKYTASFTVSPIF